MRRVAIAISCLSMLSCVSDKKADDYEFLPDTSGWVMMTHGETYSIGKLDEAGSFLPDRKWVDVRGELSAGAPPSRGLNSPPGDVYEYRSGRLIKGKLDKDGNMVPDLGSKVISFESYLKAYQPDAPHGKRQSS